MELSDAFGAEYFAFINRFLMNMLIIVIISRFIYYSRGRGSREYMFTYISTSAVIFLVCILISSVKVELGMALGLFAIFSVIRFRSVQATARELSYLFICLGISLLFALIPAATPLIRILVNALIVVGTIALADFLIFGKSRVIKNINYDRPELVAAERRAELEQDLEQRFGITGIRTIRMGDIDTLKNRVKIRIKINDPERRHFEE